jgi:hypothetical protein
MTTQHTPGPWKEMDGFIVGGPWADGEFHDICDPRCAPPDDDNTGMINANAQLIAAAPELLEELCNAREWLDELCGLIQSGMFDAASDWVGANAVSTDSTLAATIEKAMGEPVMAA